MNEDQTNSVPEQDTENTALVRIEASQTVSAPNVNPISETSSDDGGVLKDAGNDIASKFTGLPIEALICGPIIAAARGQQELSQVYIDTVKTLAYSVKDGKEETNLLKFNMQRPVTNPDGTVDKEDYNIEAPLLSLVPVPAFLMEEMTVDFTMEVKESTFDESKSHSDLATSSSYKSWFGVKASISGNVSSDSMHRRTTDNSATYRITARAAQQPPSEGMAKLTSLFAQGMEPIPGKYEASE